MYRAALDVADQSPTRAAATPTDAQTPAQALPLSYIAMCYTLLHEDGDELLDELSRICLNARMAADLPAMASCIWGCLDEL